MYCHVHFCLSSRLQHEGVSISICDALKKRTVVNLRCERIVNVDTQSIRIANADGQRKLGFSSLLLYCCPVNFYSADVLKLLRLQKQGKQLSLLDKRGNAEWSVACDDGSFSFPKL